MKFEELRSAIMNLDDQDRKRLIAEVVQTIWAASGHMDDACIALLKKFVDGSAVRDYEEQHMGNI